MAHAMTPEVLLRQAQEYRDLAKFYTRLARKFEETARLVAAAADLTSSDLTPKSVSSRPPSGVIGGVTRLDQIKDLLRLHGPMRRAELMSFGVPRGTLGNLLKEDDTFVKVGENQWGLRETLNGELALGEGDHQKE